MPPEGDAPKRAGRPHRDLDQRLRSALWAQRVRDISGLSYGSLDARFAPRVIPQQEADLPGADKRKSLIRAMDRIARHGDSPESVDGEGLRDHNLVRLAAQEFPGSETDYYSPLWTVLSGGGFPAPEPRADLIGNALARMGFVQSHRHMADFITAICGENYPGRPGSLPNIQRGAYLLANEASLDAAMVLALVARDAIDRLSLIEGQSYIDALKQCCELYDARVNAGEFAGMLHGITLTRIVRNNWQPIHPVHWPHYKTLLRNKDRERVEKDPIAWFSIREEFGPFAKAAALVQPGIPIVPYDARMDFLNGAIHEIFEVVKASVDKQKGAELTVDEVLAMSPSPLLEKAANLWPKSNPSAQNETRTLESSE